MRYALLILCFLVSFTACGKPINDYLTEPQIITSQPDSYRLARTYLFGELHYNNGIVTDVYCEQNYDANHGVGKGRIPNPEFINCEHTWPQSRFKGHPEEATIKVDLHHLFPASAGANTSRLNHPFGEVNGPIVCGTSKKGQIKGTSILGFEPPNNHKGNVARAMFYISYRYQMPIDQIQEFYFRKWHKQDPVDSFERLRNRKIESIQGSSNPFIDNPSLVDRVVDF